MPFNVTTTINRTAKLQAIKPTILDLKMFIAHTEEAGIAETVKVDIEKIPQLISGFSVVFSATQVEEVPQTASVEPKPQLAPAADLPGFD